jgi:glycosyltransferase involved in cell wall biosynthesis
VILYYISIVVNISYCITNTMREYVKIIHEDLNAGGGSERLTITMMEALNEIGFNIDLETITIPDWNKIQKWYGKFSLKIDRIKVMDLSNIFGLSEYRNNDWLKAASEEEKYRLIINAHGDILPYYNSNNHGKLKGKIITYCHYPLMPNLADKGTYKKFLLKFLKNSKFGYGLNFHFAEKRLLSNALKIYDLMMKNTIIVTNSEFSKQAIENNYGKVVLSILSPPVNVDIYRNFALTNQSRENIIIVLSRYSPDKKIETAIRIAKILHRSNYNYKMIIIGNIVKENYDYYRYLQSLISLSNLNDHVKLYLNVPLNNLLQLMATSKILLHPTLAEPFGISVAEGMSAGLIPIVPFRGGNTEFVPKQFHYKTEEEAAKIIINAMDTSHYDRVKISKFTDIFSITNFKNKLKILIKDLLEKEIAISSHQIQKNNIKTYKT